MECDSVELKRMQEKQAIQKPKRLNAKVVVYTADTMRGKSADQLNAYASIPPERYASESPLWSRF
jgi:hypothetical protein